MQIAFKNVSKKYHQGSENIIALDNISFSVPSGHTLAVIGHSGSGKTTLLSLLSGLESCDSGTIHIGSTCVSEFSDSEFTNFRAKNMGIVFQQYHLMPHLTALENVMLPLELNRIENASKKARGILEQVGLEKRIHHIPAQLSGGECQRVAIARAMVHSPQVILADEPSGSLDLKNGQAVMNLLFDMCAQSNATLVLVTHDNELAQQCQTQIHLKGGKIT